jgi:hypothetical protein
MKLARVAGVVAVLASLALAPSASAAVKAKVALLRVTNGVQLDVKLTSKKAFTRATRPRAVKLTAGTSSYKLKRVKATRKASTWRSAVQSGTAATALENLGGDRVKLKVTTKRGKRTVRGKVKALPPAPAPPPTTGPQLVRDDAAGQAAMNAGDLLLEWAEFGASGQTAEYRRIWLLQDGSFRRNIIDWNSVSGEICREAVTGTWAFKEGYTTTYNGGGVVVKLTITLSNGQSGDDVLAFPNGSSTVYVGTAGTPYERNPQIMQNC